jgi:hypothetical protein
VLASIRSKTGGDAAVCCRTRRDAVALYIASKPKKRKNRSTSSEYTRLVNLFECNLVPECSCFPCLFGRPTPPKLACQARARTAKLEDFALNLRPSSFRLYGRAPLCLVEEQQRSAVLSSVSLYLSPDRQNKVISLSWSPHGHYRADLLK